MGLNDVCDWLRLKSGVLARFGVTQSFRNALSHANKERSAEFAEKIFWSLLGHLQHASPDFATGRKGKGLLRRFKVRVHAVDQMRYGGRKSNNSLTKATNPFSRMPGIVSSSGRPISLSGRQPNYAICSNTISNPCGPWPSRNPSTPSGNIKVRAGRAGFSKNGALVPCGVNSPHEEIRRHVAQPRGPADDLFQGREALLQRHRRGRQPEDQSVHEKSLWLPQLRSAANFSLSHTWRSTRTQVHPQFLLKSLLLRRLNRNHPQRFWGWST